MRSLYSLTKTIDRFSEACGKTVAWLTLLLTLLTVFDVIARYLFKEGSVAIQELEWHLFAIIFLLSAAETFRHDAHVRVDIFYSSFSERTRALVNIMGALLLLLPLCLLLIYTSSHFVAASFSVGEGSGDPGGLPARYIIKAMIPLGFGLLALQGISDLIKNFLKVMGHKPSESQENHGDIKSGEGL